MGCVCVWMSGLPAVDGNTGRWWGRTGPCPPLASAHGSCKAAAAALPAGLKAPKAVVEAVQALVRIGAVTSLVATFRVTRTLERQTVLLREEI